MGYRGMSAAQPPVEFAQQHFGRLELGDLRLTKRASVIAQKMAAQPHASIPKQCDTTHEAKGAYRFFDHPAVNTQSITEQHPRPIATTRCAQHATTRWFCSSRTPRS